MFGFNFNNPVCDYRGDADNLKKSWIRWTSSVNPSKIFLCLPAAPEAVNGGFIPASVLRTEILPEIQRSAKFGGVMLWSMGFDKRIGYSTAIVESSCLNWGNLFTAFARPDDPSGPSAPVGIIVGVLLGTVIFVTLAIIVLCCLKRRPSPDRPNQGRNQDVEKFLLHNGLAPKRYKYSVIKKVKNSFSDKLGQGGYGSVYKGTLPDGSLVAIKVLMEVDSDGKEFLNEVASISKTSHVTIVSLLGFCYENNKRALVYEYMPNKSLDKFLSNKSSAGNADCGLDLIKMYEIAVGIAKGLEYLHTGCSTRIVHFYIKPQNILLDEDSVPKSEILGLLSYA
ncbi:hypothetical protein ACS0TY_008615 [Phlomoides rotata]